MKKFSLFIISITLFSIPLNAQDSVSVEDMSDGEKVDLLCGCVNKLMDQLHPQYKIMIKDMDEIGREEAGAKFAKYVEDNPDELEKLMEDTQMLDNFDVSIANIEGCENLNEIMDNSKSSLSLEEMEAQLNTKNECEYAAIFFRMGKKAEQQEAPKNDH